MAEPIDWRLRWPNCAVLLAGHGSSSYPDARSPALKHAEALRELGLFEDVRAGFLRQEPELVATLAELKQSRVYIVPLLLSKGHIADVVMAERLGLTGPVTRRNEAGFEQELCFCDPIGSHPKVPALIAKQIAATCRHWKLDPRDVEVLLVGHGTPRNPQSSERTREVADMLRETGAANRVHALFLEEEPLVDGWKRRVTADNVLVVPFLIGNWYHGSEDLPRRFGIDPQYGYQDFFSMETGYVSVSGDRTLFFLSPFGNEPEISSIVVALIKEFDASQ